MYVWLRYVKLERDVSVDVKQLLKHPEQMVFVYVSICIQHTYTNVYTRTLCMYSV